MGSMHRAAHPTNQNFGWAIAQTTQLGDEVNDSEALRDNITRIDSFEFTKSLCKRTVHEHCEQ